MPPASGTPQDDSPAAHVSPGRGLLVQQVGMGDSFQLSCQETWAQADSVAGLLDTLWT